MKSKEFKRLMKRIRGLAKEIGFNGFVNYSQRQYAEMLLEVANELEDQK